MILQALLIGTIVFLLISHLIERKKLKKINKHFQGPKPLPVVGNLLEFALLDIPGIFERVVELHQQYGKDYMMWSLFNWNVIMMTSSKNVEKVLLAKQTQKSLVYQFIEPWLGTGLLIASGEKWFQRRKIITPTFHFKILEQFIRVFNTETDTMVKLLKKHVGGKEFDIYDYVTLMALDSICETSMGTSVDAQHNPNNKYVQNVKRMAVLVLLRTISLLAPYPNLYDILHPNAWEQRKVIKQLHAFTDDVIRRRRQQLAQEKAENVAFDLNEENLYSKRKLTFLDLLLNVTVEGKPLSNLDIREEVDTFMFEGHDTTTSGISFTIYELARNPDVQERVYEEIVAILGKDHKTAELTYQNLQEFKYLDLVVKEGLRMYPPVGIIGREIVEDLELNGTTVPAGQQVLVPIYVIHRNPEIYPNPNQFDPNRFSEEAESKRGPFDYIPFSIGSRNCIGQRYALMEMKVSLIKLIANYRILPGESLGKLRVKTDLVLRPDIGIPVKIVLRE
ncbi:AGAP001861-PA-like protein [Anopheles sinensis]|uniref:AGAP001861-PA-like protein n=1 Tax=Anopheles sinensis TaxID=74873 RepID=A0A084VRS2_ANOSI|nr:AGAP001861-PA-like protein [Anopheles sinensis]